MATAFPRLWLDGEVVETTTAALPLMGHPAQRGSLVFDVASFNPTAEGPAIFRAADHAARFLRSSSLVGLEVAYDAATLVHAAGDLVARSGLSRGLVRWSAWFATGEPDLLPRDRRVRVAACVLSFDDPPRRAPIRVSVFDDARKAPAAVLSPEVKASGAYLGPMIGRRRAAEAGSDDVVLLDEDGALAEAPIANVFAVIAGALVTPPLGRILPGITRRSVIELAREDGIEVREAPLRPDAFAGADEAFLTSTSGPVAPIGWVNGRPLGAPAPGPVTERLVARLEDALGRRFERVYLAGSSSGAYFLAMMALSGGAAFDGYAATSGGSAGRIAPEARRVPFYVGWATGDPTNGGPRSLAAGLEAAGWPVKTGIHPGGHGAREVYLDEALRFFDGGATR